MRKTLVVTVVLFLVLAFVLTSVVGIASLESVWAQTEKTVENIKSLAGTWRGYPYSFLTNTRANNPITIYIKEDGTYKAYGQIMVEGALSLSQDKKILFQSSRVSGTVTSHEERGVQVLKFWFDNGNIAGEYERVK